MYPANIHAHMCGAWRIQWMPTNPWGWVPTPTRGVANTGGNGRTKGKRENALSRSVRRLVVGVPKALRVVDHGYRTVYSMEAVGKVQKHDGKIPIWAEKHGHV